MTSSVYLKSVIQGFLVFFTMFSPNFAQAAWEKMHQPPSAEAALDLAVCLNEPDCFYAATSHQIFKYEKNQWLPIFSLPASGDSLVRIRTFSSSPFLWIQTQKEIFRLHPSSDKPEKIYGSNDPEKFPLSFFADTDHFLVGTFSGLWISKDRGKTWNKNQGIESSALVSLLEKIGGQIFFASNGSWMRLEENGSTNILRLFDFENNSDLSETNSVLDESESLNSPGFISFFDFLKCENGFYLATRKGVFKSADGSNWSQLPNSGLYISAVSRLSWDKKNNRLLAAAAQGVFYFDENDQRWKSQNEGLAKLNIRSILAINQSLIASNSEGLWTWKEPLVQNEASQEKALLFNRLTSLEPSAREIHKKVIQYSDTSSGKIKRWHTESRLAALLPKLSLGKNVSESNNIDIDRGGTSDPDRFVEGPHDEDSDFGVDVSWDLGNMIFSTSQTSIDSRSKLTVDLRNDLLSETTRLFYERKRLQAEAVRAPASNEKIHLDRLLRIEEVTSLLDALTNGFLSQRLEEIYKFHPEFEKLWKFEKPRT